MKLYTEEQVKKAYEDGNSDGFNHICISDTYLNFVKPIELPSDEEIESYANFAFPYTEIKRGDNYVAYRGMKIGAKWVIEQIIQQKDGTI